MEEVKAVYDWEALLATSYYHTVQAIQQALTEGHAEEAQHVGATPIVSCV